MTPAFAIVAFVLAAFALLLWLGATLVLDAQRKELDALTARVTQLEQAATDARTRLTADIRRPVGPWERQS